MSEVAIYKIIKINSLLTTEQKTERIHNKKEGHIHKNAKICNITKEIR